MISLRLPAFVPMYYNRRPRNVKRKINIFLENFAASAGFPARQGRKAAKFLAFSGKLWYNRA